MRAWLRDSAVLFSPRTRTVPFLWQKDIFTSSCIVNIKLRRSTLSIRKASSVTMAPVTRNFLKTISSEQKKSARTGVSLDGKHYKPFRLVHCTVHLDQMQKNNPSLRKVEKLGQKSFKKTTGRIIHPLTFKLFKSEMLSQPTKDGNVTFIINYDKLLTRFPRVYDNGVSKTSNGFSQNLLLTRGKRDVSRYTPLAAATPSTKGDIWWRDDDQNMVLTPADPKSEEQLDLEVHVDALHSDYKWLRKNCACEFLNHEECTKFGDLCTNLMDRGVAWEACNFQPSFRYNI